MRFLYRLRILPLDRCRRTDKTAVPLGRCMLPKGHSGSHSTGWILCNPEDRNKPFRGY
jgi:hypothetical protein